MSKLTYVYRFRDMHFARDGKTLVSVADAAFVRQFMSDEERYQLFGRSVTYTDYTQKLDYIGVYGSRNASRFRRILRERGAVFEIQNKPPPDTRYRFSTWRDLREKQI